MYSVIDQEELLYTQSEVCVCIAAYWAFKQEKMEGDFMALALFIRKKRITI